MPTRPVIALILLGWAFAAASLFRRDILPDLWLVPPPDLRAIAVAEADDGPTNWTLSVATDDAYQNLRPVGRATTATRRNPDGGTTLTGTVAFDSDGLLRGTMIDPRVGLGSDWGHMEMDTTCAIDPSGNLAGFAVRVRPAGSRDALMTIDAHVVGHTIEVEGRGGVGPFARKFRQTLPYEPRGLVQNSVAPIDRLPGLQVGQRWETEVISPITGLAQRVRTEVTGRTSIPWNNELVTTLEVVQRMDPISARTWVRRDGLVLRQEVPIPFCRLILERLPPRSNRHDPLPAVPAPPTVTDDASRDQTP